MNASCSRSSLPLSGSVTPPLFAPEAPTKHMVCLASHLRIPSILTPLRPLWLAFIRLITSRLVQSPRSSSHSTYGNILTTAAPTAHHLAHLRPRPPTSPPVSRPCHTSPDPNHVCIHTYFARPRPWALGDACANFPARRHRRIHLVTWDLTTSSYTLSSSRDTLVATAWPATLFADKHPKSIITVSSP